MSKLPLLLAALALAMVGHPAAAALPGEAPDAARLTLGGVFTNAGVPMKAVLFGLVFAVLAAAVVWTVQLARRGGASPAAVTYLCAQRAAAPLFGFFGAFYAILSSCIGIANVQPIPTLTILAPGLAEASLSAGLGLLAAAIAVVGERHLQARGLGVEPARTPVEAGRSTGEFRAAI